jgi:hypothetical protein
VTPLPSWTDGCTRRTSARPEHGDERVGAAVEDARRSLPADFQGRRIVERIDGVIAERCERLRKALSEPLGS